MVEIWKPSINYEGLYEISNLGRIKSLINNHGTLREKILKPIKNNTGYFCVFLCKNKIIKRYNIHRLILEAFVGPCPIGKEACHNDGNRENYSIENLRWGTRKENFEDRTRHGNSLIGIKNPRAKLNEKQVRIIKWLLEDKYLTHKEIAQIFNVSRHTITKINNNKLWKHIS
jgi:DNA-binding XRE family transcriptional regulator